MSELGVVTIISEGNSGYLTTSDADDENAYVITLPNSLNYSTADLTVAKSVTGAFGDTEREFTFTLTVEGASNSERYAWKKNGVSQSQKLRSGGTFTLKNGDNVTLSLPKYVKITLAEDNPGYDTSFQVGDQTAESGNTKTLVLAGNTSLSVVNARDSLLPTGVKTNIVLSALLLLSGIAGTAFVFTRRREQE